MLGQGIGARFIYIMGVDWEGVWPGWESRRGVKPGVYYVSIIKFE